MVTTSEERRRRRGGSWRGRRGERGGKEEGGGVDTAGALVSHCVLPTRLRLINPQETRSGGRLRVVVEDPARSQVSALSQHQLGKPHDRLLFSFTQLPILTNSHHHPPCRSPAFKDFSCPPCRSPAFKDFSCFQRLLLLSKTLLPTM